MLASGSVLVAGYPNALQNADNCLRAHKLAAGEAVEIMGMPALGGHLAMNVRRDSDSSVVEHGHEYAPGEVLQVETTNLCGGHIGLFATGGKWDIKEMTRLSCHDQMVHNVYTPLESAKLTVPDDGGPVTIVAVRSGYEMQVKYQVLTLLPSSEAGSGASVVAMSAPQEDECASGGGDFAGFSLRARDTLAAQPLLLSLALLIGVQLLYGVGRLLVRRRRRTRLLV